MAVRAGWMLAALCISAGIAAAAGSPTFQRYEVILDRKPFGVEPPPPPPPVVPPVPPGESVVNQMRMTAVVRDDADVVRVGLVDQKAKKNYFLAVGETVDGIEIVEADYQRERARLRRGVEDYWVYMAGSSNKFEAVTASAPPPGHPLPGALTNRMSLAITGSVRQAVAQDKRLSYALRRQMREEARRKKEQELALAAAKPELGKDGKAVVSTPAPPEEPAPAEEEMSEQEIMRLLQEYQKELIRTGQQPLAIPLTPETDKELVTEGVLPPQPEEQ